MGEPVDVFEGVSRGSGIFGGEIHHFSNSKLERNYILCYSQIEADIFISIFFIVQLNGYV